MDIKYDNKVLITPHIKTIIWFVLRAFLSLKLENCLWGFNKSVQIKHDWLFKHDESEDNDPQNREPKKSPWNPFKSLRFINIIKIKSI